MLARVPAVHLLKDYGYVRKHLCKKHPKGHKRQRNLAHQQTKRRGITGTVTAHAVVPVPWRKSAFWERKTDLQKTRNALKRPTEALHGPLPPFRDIYPWKQKGFEIGRFSRCFVSERQNWTNLDNLGQFWTILDNSGHCPESVNFTLCWRGAGSTFAHNSRIQDCAIGDNHRQSQLSQMSQLSQFH